MAPPTSPPAAAAEPQPTTLPNYFTLVYLDAIIQMLNEQTDQAQTTAQALIDNISLPDHERAGAQRVLDTLDHPPLARTKLALDLVKDILASILRTYSRQTAVVVSNLLERNKRLLTRAQEMIAELRSEGELDGLKEALDMLSLTVGGSRSGTGT